MASSTNSLKDYNTSSGAYAGNWEDIKDYTSAIITLNRNSANKFSKSVTVTLEWAHTSGRTLPDQTTTANPNIVATESFAYSFNVDNSVPVTRQYDHRARWFRVRTTFATDGTATDANGTFDLQTLYKRAPTELKIVDDTANVVSVNAGNNGNSLYTLLTDHTGAPLKTTAPGAAGSALYTHLADSNGVSLATTVGSLVQVGTCQLTAAGVTVPLYVKDIQNTGTAALAADGTKYVARNGANSYITFTWNGTLLVPDVTTPVTLDDVFLAGITGTSDFKANNYKLATGNPLTDINNTQVSFTLTVNNSGKSLFVGLRDANNVAFSTTGPTAANNAIYIRPGDSAGVAQASTIGVNGAATPGVALFGALADNSGMQITTTRMNTTGQNGNSLFVHLTDGSGNSISKTNPLPVISTIDTVGAKAFDMERGLQQYLKYPISDLSGVPADQQINLYNLCIFNDHASTVWVKIYDLSFDSAKNIVGLGAGVTGGTGNGTIGTGGTDLKSQAQIDADTPAAAAAYAADVMTKALKYNLTVQPGKSRDMVFPGGATFYGGILVRVTTAYAKDSMQGPGEDAVFINGSYLKETTQPI